MLTLCIICIMCMSEWLSYNRGYFIRSLVDIDQLCHGMSPGDELYNGVNLTVVYQNSTPQMIVVSFLFELITVASS